MWSVLDYSAWTNSQAESTACQPSCHQTGMQRHFPAKMIDMKIQYQVKESVGVPVVANGDIRNEVDVVRVREETGVDGEWSRVECSFQ